MFIVIKSLHIVFVVSWFAGLFYLVRLFVYHTEAQEKEQPEKSLLSTQFTIMEKRLMNAITTPAMVITWLTGLSMIYINPYFLDWWLYVKLALVFVLTLYHIHCIKIIKAFENQSFSFTSKQLRMYNEVATVILIGVVFLVETKNILSAFWAIIGFVVFAIVVFGIIAIVKKQKKRS